MVDKTTRAISLRVCMAALVAAGIVGNAQAAVPDTKRVIVAF